MNNVSNTFLEQYASSPTITGMIQSFNLALDPTIDFQNFYNNIWNIKTASGYGLDVWGNIVGVSRVLQVSSGGQYFGFYEAYNVANGANNPTPFNDSPFYASQTTTSSYTLADDQYRRLILAKAFANISNYSAQQINFILTIIYSNIVPPYDYAGYHADGYVITDGNIQYQYAVPGDFYSGYISDTGSTIFVRLADQTSSMTMKVLFNYQPSALDLAILLNSGVFPRPCGVQLTYGVTL